MKTQICLYLSLCVLMCRGGAQNWIPQGTGLLPFGYSVNNISVVDEDVVWISANFTVDAQYSDKLFRTLDGGENWEVLDLDFCGDCIILDLKAQSATSAWMTALFESQIGRLYKTEDGGQSWEMKLSQNAAKGDIQVFDNEHILCRHEHFIRYTLNGGETWLPGIFNGTYPDNAAFAQFSSGRGVRGAAIGDTAWMGMIGNELIYNYASAKLIRATGYGEDVDLIDTGLDSVASIEFVSFTDHLNGMMKYKSWHQITEMDYYYGWFTYFIKLEDALARTSDGGETWERVQSPVEQVFDISAVPGSRNTYVLVGNNKIYLTPDAGNSWVTEEVAYPLCCAEFLTPTVGWVAIEGTAGNQPLVLKWNGDFPSGTQDDISVSNTKLDIFPNPAHDVVHYTLEDDDLQHHNVTLTDAAGKVIFARTSQRQEININHLPEGIYFLKVMTMDFNGIAKVVISRK